MCYFVYLFSSLILICNNFVRSNENEQKVTWTCASLDCNTPISEFVTTSNLKTTDHRDKLKYDIRSRGQVLKKSADNSEFWFAQINGKKGYVNKNSIREETIFFKNLQFQVTEDYPFQISSNPNEINKISPSQPTVVDGTTLYDNDLSESDSNKVLLPANNIESTPLLSPTELPDLTGSSQNNKQSTLADSVDPSASVDKNPQDSTPIDSLNIGTEIPGPYSEVTPSPSDNNNKVEVENKGGKTESYDNKGSVGVGSSTPVDDYFEDDDVQIEVEEGDEQEYEVPPKLQSTNKRDQSESISKTDDKLKVTTEQSDNIVEKELGKESVSKDNEAIEAPPKTLFETITTFLKDELPNNGTASNSEELQKSPEEPSHDTSAEAPVTEQSDVAEDITRTQTIDTSVEETVTKKPDEPKKIFSSDGTISNFTTVEGNMPEKSESNTTPSPEEEEGIMDFNVKTEFDAGKQNNDNEKEGVDPSKLAYQQEDIIRQQLSNKFGSPYVYNVNQQPSPPPSHVTYTPGYFHEDVSTTPTPADVSSEPTMEGKTEYSHAVTNAPDVTLAQTDVTEAPAPINAEEESRDNLNESSENEVDSSTENLSTESPTTDQETFETTTASSEDLTFSSAESSTDKASSDFEESKHEMPRSTEDLVNPPEETLPQESVGFYSSISSFFSSLTELFDKSKLPEEAPSMGEEVEDKTTTESPSPTAPPGHCSNGVTCKGLEPPIGGEDQDMSYWNPYSNDGLFKSSVPMSFNSILYICITSVVILLFSLGYYYIDKSQNSSTLVAKVNQLSQELFVTKKERDSLEDQLLKIKENCNIMDSSKIKQDSKLSSLQSALEKSESARSQLEETVLRLEKEVETLMDQGMEMHKLLSETISDEERSQMLLANIDELKESLSEKLDEIVILTNQLDKKNEEIQLGQIDVRNANDRIADLERKLESCKTETEETFTKKLQDQQKQNIKLQKLLEEKGMSIAKLESELAKTKAEKDSAEARASSAEGGLQAAHGVGAGEARQTWIDATAARAALATVEKQNETLQLRVKEINTNNKLLQDKISSLSEELSGLNLKYEDVEKDKINALTKLQVLSEYFKEKETKLQEELGMKESLWLQKESEDHTIYEQMKSLREEIASYKAQNEKLRAEILEQEASYKVQIANEEQKTYDNWVALRQAERKVKELQMESSHFRNRLTQLETANNQSTTEALNPNGLDKTSYNAPSPPFMMLPPPPSAEFFSLPPAPLHPTASRPPPLGRISSPQLTGEMIPPPPLVPFEMYPPPPSSTPPPPIPLYKPQPRDRPPPPKDYPPSNYSSESVNDKPPRRRRR